jgi:hypothetical protein
MDNQETLTKLANASGFLLQLGLEHAIRATRSEHSWSVISREHPWASRQSGPEGFIDLVLRGWIVIGVVECKRTRGGSWLFLVPNGSEAKRKMSRTLWVAGTQDGRSVSGWDDIEHLPPSYVSSFCIARGSGENDRPLLERLCATLLCSVDALAEEEISILQRENGRWQRFYLPMIVTTAELLVCRFGLHEVDISKGTIDSGVFETVPFIRFQKAFSTSAPPGFKPTDLATAAAAHERTVLVIQAEQFADFLALIRELDFRERHPYPWENAFAMMQDSTA